MTALVATVAAASVVLPLVISGEQLGELHEAGCSAKPVQSVFESLREAGRAPTQTAPIVIDTGELLAPDPNTRYAVTRGGPSLRALARALTVRTRSDTDGPAGRPPQALPPPGLRADAERQAGGESEVGPNGRVVPARDRPGAPLFDIMVPGKFDLALRRDRLAILTEQAKLPWVIANLKPRFPHQAYRIVERDGVRVGLTAIIDDRLAPQLHPRVRPESLVPARKALGDAVRALRAEGVDLVVAVSHQASDTALKAIIRMFEGATDRPDVFIMSPIAGEVMQVSLGQDAPVILAAPDGTDRALVAHVEVSKRAGTRPRFLGARRIQLEARDDPALADVRREVCEALDRAVGPGVASVSGQALSVTREAFTQFVLELMRRRAGAEVAIINRNTIRDVFPMDTPLSALDLMRAIPFDDGIQVADVSGSKMSSLFRLASDGRAEVSGIQSGRIAGRTLDRGRTYRVATVDFVAEGGDEIFKPKALPWVPVEELGELRELVSEYLATHGFDPDADPDPDGEVAEPTLLSAQLNLGGNLKTVTVSNSGEYEAPQLSRNQFLGITALFDLRVIADMARHRFQIFERTRYGIAREGTGDAEENDDVTTVELTYIGRFATKNAPWYIPNASAAVSLETELTVPDEGESERDYRRALFQAGIGPSFPLLSNISARVQLGLRRELLASGTSDDEQERLLAETRMALLSTFEILNYTFPTDYGRPLSATLRVDHAFDLTGSVRDNILQGRLDFDIPVARHLSVTVGLELYFQDRDVDMGPDPTSGLAFDTSFGVKTFGDISTVLF